MGNQDLLNKKNQEILNKTVEKIISFWVQRLTPPIVENDSLELNSEPTILQIQLQVNYPTAKELENFVKKLAVYVILKLEKNKFFFMMTKETPQGEFGNLVLSSGIDKKLFPQNTKMVVSLGRIKKTDFMGQEEIINIS